MPGERRSEYPRREKTQLRMMMQMQEERLRWGRVGRGWSRNLAEGSRAGLDQEGGGLCQRLLSLARRWPLRREAASNHSGDWYYLHPTDPSVPGQAMSRIHLCPQRAA